MIDIYTLANILPGSHTIWQILNALSPKYAARTYLLRVSRGALVPPAP